MVGVHVVLDIVPHRIDAAAWAEAFEETRGLLEAHPARLLGYGFRLAAGVRVPVFTRSVVQGGDDPAALRWCVVGDRTTLATGERQRMYRDLGRYLARCPPSVMERSAEPQDDILTSSTGGPARVRVFGEGGQSEPCRLALLAAAMVVETSFPRDALVSGRFDREQAEAARRWAKGILGRAIALPVRVDAWRLVERLGLRLEGEALVQAVDRLYLAEHPSLRATALLGVFGRAEAEPWFTAKLREASRDGAPDVGGALHLATAYLDATRDPARLAWLACLDPRGPRWSPEAFVTSLAALTDHRGAPRPRLDEVTLEQALGVVFGENAARLGAAYRAALRRAGALQSSSSMGASIGAPEEPPASDASEPFASTASPGELDVAQRESVHALAWVVRDLQRSIEDHGGPVSTGAARRTVAILLSRSGPTLTEDAWDWIDREDDPDLCAFLAALATLEPADAASDALRRALLENRTLCRYAAGVSRASRAGAAHELLRG
jgi:hypothetical protein